MAKGGTKSQLCCGNFAGDASASPRANDRGFCFYVINVPVVALMQQPISQELSCVES